MTRSCLIFGLLFAQFAKAYPEFIGYKYASCLTCHYNGQGNGPINDYGRALWSAEIAGRLWSGQKTDEQLAESSGFLGKTELPWWFRPGMKTRYLNYKQNPGTSHSSSRGIFMQAEVNTAIFFNKNQKYAFVGSLGYAPKPFRYQSQTQGPKIDTLISREHYLRIQATNDLWIYAGMLDKVYGIRIIDHTAYSRSRTGVAQNDQTHGIIAHYIQPQWEITGHLFAGNLYQDSTLRQKGISGMFEYEVRPAWRIGASVLGGTNKYINSQRIGIHSKMGLGHGTAILFELGNIRDTPLTQSTKNGYYMFAEGIQKIKRGYHIFVTGQAYKDDMISSQPDNIKMGAGLLAFPMARTEFRIEVENSRQILGSAEVPKDSWVLLTQIHLSL